MIYNIVHEEALSILREYEDLGKSPEELRETLDKDNRLISEYAEENKRLKEENERYKQTFERVRRAAQKLHNAALDIGLELNI